MTERLALIVTGDTSDAVRAIGDLEKTGGRSLGNTENRATRLGSSMSRTLTPAALGAGAAFGVAFMEFDAGADALRAAGAQGDEFTDSMKAVGSQVPASLGEVGTVMGEIFQRTQLTGKPLEELTQRVLELGELGQSVNVEQLTASLAKSGVAAEDMADALDVMFRVSQVTGTSVDKLSQLQEQFGAALDLAGFSMEDQLLLLGQFEKSGVNTSTVMAGMTRGLRDLAASGEDPAQALAEIIDQMKGAKTEAEAVAIANDVFGKSAVEVAAAVRNGTLDLGAMQAALAANDDSISEAAEGTRDWAEKLSMLQNKVVGIIGPVGQYGMALSGIAAGLGPALSGVGKLTDAHPKLMSTLGTTGAVVGGAVAVWGAWTMMIDDARETGARFADGIRQSTLGVDSSTVSVDRLREQYTTLAGGINDVISEYNGSNAPWDADKRAEQEQWIEDNTATAGSMERIILQSERIASQYGVSEDAAAQWLVAQSQLGNEFGTGQAALDAYGQQVEENNGLTTEQTQSIEESTAALQEWEAALRAQFDPLFAVNDALRQQKEAQDAANGATWLYGPASAEAYEANLALAEANLTASAASARLAEGIANGTVSLEESTSVIDGWVASGQMSEEQAESVRTQFFLLGLEADRLDGRDVKMTVTTDYKGVPVGGVLKQFAQGGEVDGPKGAPQLAIVHGGEHVLTVDEVDRLKAGGGTKGASMTSGGGGVAFPDRLYLVVEDRQFTAYLSTSQRRTEQGRYS